jgi:chloramphenicol 3-O phosphotransferase
MLTEPARSMLGSAIVDVRCDSTFAAGREIARGDRVAGMALPEAEVLHRRVLYDPEVDTTHTEAMECARTIATEVR